MKLDEIRDLIAAESPIDSANLDSESLTIPYKHSRWYGFMIDEISTLRVLQYKYKTLKKDKYIYYSGKAADEDYINQPLDYKLQKGEMQLFLESDKELLDIENRIGIQELKVSCIEAFIKQINQMSFNIKNAIEFQKFKNGF